MVAVPGVGSLLGALLTLVAFTLVSLENPRGRVTNAVVVRVIDGDTVELISGERMREAHKCVIASTPRHAFFDRDSETRMRNNFVKEDESLDALRLDAKASLERNEGLTIFSEDRMGQEGEREDGDPSRGAGRGERTLKGEPVLCI